MATVLWSPQNNPTSTPLPPTPLSRLPLSGSVLTQCPHMSRDDCVQVPLLWSSETAIRDLEWAGERMRWSGKWPWSWDRNAEWEDRCMKRSSRRTIPWEGVSQRLELADWWEQVDEILVGSLQFFLYWLGSHWRFLSGRVTLSSSWCPKTALTAQRWLRGWQRTTCFGETWGKLFAEKGTGAVPKVVTSGQVGEIEDLRLSNPIRSDTVSWDTRVFPKASGKWN